MTALDGAERPSAPPDGGPIVVVHLIGTLSIGGAERQILELIRELRVDRFEQHLALFHREGAFLGELGATECDVFEVLPRRERSRWRIRRLPTLVAGGIRFVAFLRRVRPDVLHSQLPAANILAAVAGRLARVDVIVNSQLNLCRDRDGRTVAQKLENRALRGATAIHANSHAVAADLIEHQGVDPSLVQVIHNGVDTDRFVPPGEGERAAARAAMGCDAQDRLILCVANLFPFKGHLDLVRAFARLEPATREVRLTLVGRDEGVAVDIARLAHTLGVDQRVHVVGPTAEVERWYAAADVLAHPSHEEGFSNTILEAMSSGLPVVACPVGGNPEAVVDGVTGFLVPPQDPARMAEALAGLLDDPATATAMGRRGRSRVTEHFGREQMGTRFAAWYGELVAAARARPRRSGRPTLGGG